LGIKFDELFLNVKNKTINSCLKLGVIRLSFPLSFSFYLKRSVKVFFNSVNKAEDISNGVLVSTLSLVLFKHLGKKLEEGTISVGKSLFFRLEGFQFGGDLTEHAGFEEFSFFGFESLTDDLSDIFDHVLD